ncbi:MAG: sel1 repeat family protein [Akkermansia sp.]|nr:sel1 repeat family protein [Akkermansia sp.]
MNNILKHLCLLGLLAGSALALTPEEKLARLNEAFGEGNIAEGEKWGYSMLKDGDTRSIQLLLEYFNDIGYAPELQKALRKKAAEMNLNTELTPNEGAPWRLHAIALDSEYDSLSAENDAAGIRELGLRLSKAGGATHRYGIGLLYVAASMGDTEALDRLAAMYRQGTDVPRDSESADYLIAGLNATTESHAAISEVFGYCLGQGGTPDLVRERGVDFAEGRNGVKTNENTAIILYRVAADMGDAKAARWMGWRYLQGRGVKKSRKLAEQYFTIAAIQGDPGAQDALKSNFGKTVRSSN